MGKTNKPLYIQVSGDIYKTAEQMWADLTAQGHIIQILQYEEYIPDIILAPQAMRMTPDMLTAMPSALTLAIKGARELRYAPHGTGAVKGKPKVAKDKKPRKGQNSTLTVTTTVGGTPGDAQVYRTPVGEDQGVRESGFSTVDQATHNERVS